MATSALITETTFPGTAQIEAGGVGLRRVQEWLTLQGHGVVLDGRPGPATSEAIRSFQNERRLKPDGVVGPVTWSYLIAPMVRATGPADKFLAEMTGPGGDISLNGMIVLLAHQHLREHPREVGGQNRGPWVRLYCDGNEGDAWAWCAGFATYVVKQARAVSPHPADISPGMRTYSCDALANSFKADGKLIAQATQAQATAAVTPGCIFFLVDPKNLNDRHHTGIVTEVAKDGSWVKTIEGNTNDEGSREGYEVCARTRAVGKLDFGIVAKRA